MNVKYAAPALVGVILVLAAFTVDQSEFTGEAVAVGMVIIGMAMIICGVLGLLGNFGYLRRR